MISPLVATQASTPIASIQQNADAQSILHSQNALHETQEQEREKHKRLRKAMDELNKKYGEGAVIKASLMPKKK